MIVGVWLSFDKFIDDLVLLVFVLGNLIVEVRNFFLNLVSFGIMLILMLDFFFILGWGVILFLLNFFNFLKKDNWIGFGGGCLGGGLDFFVRNKWVMFLVLLFVFLGDFWIDIILDFLFVLYDLFFLFGIWRFCVFVVIFFIFCGDFWIFLECLFVFGGYFFFLFGILFFGCVFEVLLFFFFKNFRIDIKDEFVDDFE